MNRTLAQQGFTLVELAIAVFIIALLLGSILVPLTTQVEQRQITETQKTMEEIREALIGFAMTKGHLPCPDLQVGGVPNDGIEDVAAGQCTAIIAGPNPLAAGNVPWVTLGMGNQDAWGNRFRYTVLALYAQRPLGPPPPNPPTFNLVTPGGLRVCPTSPCDPTVAGTAVAVIISHGKNGLGAINAATNAANPPPPATWTDEVENANNDVNAVSRTQSNAAVNPFDDIVVWIPKFTLNSRMVAAGRLP